MSVRIGTSGWQYDDWRGVLYPLGVPQKEWLETYAATFDTVEVNATFYRLPTISAVQRWAETVPAGFVFAVKASRYLSHIKRLREPEEPVQRLLTRIAPLRESGVLGPVLLQLPPDMRVAVDLLDATLVQFPAEIDVAVEPRHESWFCDAVHEVLERHGSALVWADRDGKSLGPLWSTTDWCYLRLHHGRDAWGYNRADLVRWAQCVGEAGRGYVFCNNDPGGAAVRDALTLRDLVP